MNTVLLMRPSRFAVALWLSSILLAAAPVAAQLRLDVYASGLASPVGFVQDPSTPSLQYVIEQGGRIRVIQDGTLLTVPFLNIAGSISSGGERGLLGLAFAPDYATSRRFFVYFTNPDGNPVVARFKRQVGNPLLADPASRFDLRWGGPSGQRFISHPFSNHNGGHLAFGPDDYLYIASGDGGSGNDPQNHAQNPNSLLGKLLRIDVSVPDSDTEGYVVPPDNPFTDNIPIAALHEIWAFGLRNPWKFSFDATELGGTGAMFIGDVGQNSWEEIDYQPPGIGGRNYGWRIREGAHPTPGVPATSPAYLPLIDPIFEYSHAVGSSISGGFVYRGVRMRPLYRGRYYFADFVTGRLFSIGLIRPPDGSVVVSGLVEHTAEIGGNSVTGMVSAFGQDAFGEIYVVSYSRGMVLKLVDPGASLLPRPRADFNRDELPDLIWFNESTRGLAVWSMSGHLGATAARGVFLNAPQVPAGWRVLGAGDVDRDGHTDLFVQSNSGQIGVWLFDGTTFRYGAWLNPSTAVDPLWRVRAIGDFNRDGFPDVVWQYGPTGLVAFWLLNGVEVVADSVVGIGGPGPDWEVVGTGDANGDGETDLYWQHRVNGTLALWRMNGTQYVAASLLSASPDDSNWRVVATSDLNLDGLIELIFQHALTGGLGAWYLDDETVLFGGSLNPWHAGDPNWKMIGPR